MKRSKVINVFKSLTIAIVVALFLFLFCELVARALYPEFTNNVFTDDMTRGKYMYLVNYYGVAHRAPYKGSEFEEEKNRNLIVIFGDSITYGYGHDYEDIYWVRLQRLMDLLLHNPPRILPFADSANNLFDFKDSFENLIKNYKLPIKMVVYQFNFNDIMPYSRVQIKEEMRPPWYAFIIAKWRYSYLNRSTFLRLLQHHAGSLRRKTSGSCEERGIDALGMYSWTYGSVAFKEESERLWGEFEDSIRSLKNIMDRKGIKFAIFISPILFDIDTVGYHPHYNYLNIDFQCATISPRNRLMAMAKKYKVDIIDPTEYLKSSFERRVKGKNFTPYFFGPDDNHFNEVASDYISTYMMSYIMKNKTVFNGN